MITIFLRVLSIFVLVLLGFISGKIGKATQSSLKTLSYIVIYVCSPCLAFSSITAQKITPDIITPILQVVIGTIIIYGSFSFIAIPLIKLFKIGAKEDLGIYIISLVARNTGFMGFPVTLAIFGSTYLFLMVFQNFLANIYYFVVSLYIINIGHNTDSNNQSPLKRIIKPFLSPVILFLFLAIIVQIFDIKVPIIVNDLILMIGNATSFLSMFALGLQLSFTDYFEMFKDKNIIKTTVLSLLLVPAIIIGVVYLLPITMQAKLTLSLSVAFPTAVAVSTVAEDQSRNPQQASKIVSMSTLCSMITLPLWIGLISKLFL